MDHNQFWENVFDLIKLLLKIILLLLIVQIVFNVSGANIDIPYVKTLLTGLATWLKQTFGIFHIGI